MAQIEYKGFLVILDGLGDRSIQRLGGRTPLEAAATPNLDQLVQQGICGMLDPLQAGVPVGTHTGTALLLGLAPADALALSRGPVEAAGIGLRVEPGDVLSRCNFATLEPDGGRGYRIIDRRAGRIREGTHELAAALDGIPLGHGISALLRPATHHRAVLRLRGVNVSSAISDTDPGSRFGSTGLLESAALDPKDAVAAVTAEALNQFSRQAYQRLCEHPLNRKRVERGLLPANGILCRSPGRAERLRCIVRHLGLAATTVAGESTVIGLSRLFGFDAVERPSFTSLPDTDVEAKVDLALSALQQRDLVILHIKGTDICAHDQEPEKKRDLLERIDRALEPVCMQPDLVIAVTGDHSTDSNAGRHTGDPVPSLLYAPNGRRDGCERFGETACLCGGLGRITATGFLCSMLDAMGAMHNYHPADRPFLTAS